MNNKQINERRFKVIIKPSIARKLIQAGNQVFDIKPNKGNKEASVFVFENNDKLKKDLKLLLKTKKIQN